MKDRLQCEHIRVLLISRFEIKLLEIGEKDIWRKCGPVLRPFPDFQTILNKEVPKGLLHFEPRVILLKDLFLDLSTQEETLPNAYNVPQSS